MKRSKSVSQKKEKPVIAEASLRQLQSFRKSELLDYAEKNGLQTLKRTKEEIIISILSYNKSTKDRVTLKKKNLYSRRIPEYLPVQR